MTFANPGRLVLIAAPLLLIAGYLWLEHRRKAVAVRFTSVELLASVAPKRPGWQRHLAPAMLCLTLVCLVVGFAQPFRNVRTPRQEAVVVLAVDVSGSMIATDVAPDRLTAAKQAAEDFVDALPSGIQLGLVSFSTHAQVLVSPTTERDTVRAAIERLSADGGTSTGDAISVAVKSAEAAVDAKDGDTVPAAIVLMSDGKPNQVGGEDSATKSVDEAVAAAKADGIKINTIAFGTESGTVTLQGETIPVPSDPEAMAQIASSTGGETFTAESASQLKSVYSDIGKTVGYVTEHKEVTAFFTGLGLIVGAAAAAAALTFGHRIA